MGKKLDGEARQQAAIELAERCGVVVLLKGHRTLVTDGKRQAINTTGNPGMATGGSGDVLSGLITALLCQHLEPFAAAQLGAHLHGLAGDLAAKQRGEVSLIARDLVEFLPEAFGEYPPRRSNIARIPFGPENAGTGAWTIRNSTLFSNNHNILTTSRFMIPMLIYRILADCVVAVHLAIVLFVVLGMGAIVAGIVLKWQWVRNFWFRLIHLLMIATVVVEAILEVSCPLTDWEDNLRERAGETVQQGTFIGRMLHGILFWDVSRGTMTIIYCLFGLGVVLVFILAPPRWPRRKSSQK